MVTGIIGRKVGMTQVFGADGVVTPVTVLQAGPCVVVQAKTVAKDGYQAVQIGLVESRPARVNKAIAGHYAKAQVPPTRVRREVKVAAGGEAPAAGEQVVCSIFAAGDRVDVIATSKGKGFQGVIKRHNFAGGAATHGSMFHRAPGGIGASSFPSRVIKGTGRARVSDLRNPLWRKGGVVFPPQPRDYAFALPKKVKRGGLREALAFKVQAGAVTIVDALAVTEVKTKAAAEMLKALGGHGKTLVVDVVLDEKLALSTRNIAGVQYVAANRISARAVMDAARVIATRSALEKLQAALS